MYIFNLKNICKSVIKAIVLLTLLILLFTFVFNTYKYLSSKAKVEKFIEENSCNPNNSIAVIKPENYTNVLKQVHEDLHTYIGQRISFDGYIYKIQSFNDNQFVLARDMDIGNNQKLIVGFLCESNKINNFNEYDWVTIAGEITEGNYNNSKIPIIKITEINLSNPPDNKLVPMPSSDFIPTSNIY